jgi:glycerol kinase
MFLGLNLSTSQSQILSSLLESISFRLYDNIKLAQFSSTSEVFVDGGMTINKEFMQMQADLFNKKIIVS